MEKKQEGTPKITALRWQAEVLLRTTKRDVAAMTGEDIQQLVHELQVHQIELEMQNDDLRRTQGELEAARDRYAELYDFSPAGHLTLDVHGKIIEANLRGAALLGVNRKGLLRQPLARFIAAVDEDTFYRHCREVLKTGTRQICEVRIRAGAGLLRWVYLESLAVHDEAGHITHWRTALLDISDRHMAGERLKAQQAQLEGIIGSAMDAIITVDERNRVMLFNHAAESMFLCPAGDAIGESLERFIPERFTQASDGQMSVFRWLRAASPSRGPYDILFGLRSNGEEFPFEASVSHVRVDGQDLVTVILRDITERKVAEEALQSSDAFARAVLNSLASHVCVLDRQGVILRTNDAWKTFARYDSARLFSLVDEGQNYLEICRRARAEGEPGAALILEGVEAVLGGSQASFSAEYACHAPEEERWFLMRVTPLKGAKGAKGAKGVVISHLNISDRVRMARSLEHHILLLGKKSRELESLAGKLIQAQEQERERIARELHDDFNQRLAALSVELESLERAPIAPPEPVARQLAVIRGMTGRLSDDLHDLAYKLHPSLLEHVGLEVASRDHIAEFTKRTGLPVMFIVHEAPERLLPEVATNLFRVMQESLQNVFKHAQATHITVRLIGSPKGIGLSVSDNGKGFDPDCNQGQRAGLGVVSMQERARLLGGVLRIHSRVADGTKVCAWIPFSGEGA